MSVSQGRSASVVGSLTGQGANRLKAGDERIIVIGAGGWLGLATLELLHRLLGPTAFAKRVVAFGSSPRRLDLRDGLGVEQLSLEALGDLSDGPPSLVLHLAFLTQEKAALMSEVDYIQANRAITGKVLTSLDGLDACGVFLPSSGAVYSIGDLGAQASLRLYGRLKLEDEAALERWMGRRDGRAAVVRVFNLSGPYINKISSYALACFINDALAGRPISIRATRKVYRSYVAISELMSVVFGVLTGDAPGLERFDTAGNEVLEMSDLASLVHRTLGTDGGIDRPLLAPVPADRYVGERSGYALRRDRYEASAVGIADQILETAAFLAAGADPRRQAW